MFKTIISWKECCRTMSSGNLPFLSSKYSVCWAGFDHWREVLSFWSTLQVKFAVPPSTTVTFCVSGNCPWLPEEGWEGREGEGKREREKKKKKKGLNKEPNLLQQLSTRDSQNSTWTISIKYSTINWKKKKKRLAFSSL